MKFIKRIVILLLLLTVLSLALGSIFVRADTDEQLTYLILGLDDSNRNTDAIMLFTFNPTENTVAVLQIPRDTYCNYGGGQNKINGLYAYLLKKYGEKEALVRLKEIFEQIFSIKIDGYLAIEIDAFCDLVDEIGGVEINLNKDLKLDIPSGEGTLNLNSGVNKLSGREAEIFVRHRKSYVLADVARMDAQKLFINAFFKKVCQDTNPLKVALFLKKQDVGVYFEFKITDFFKNGGKIRGRISKSKKVYMTLPGEAITIDGVSYYVINKRASEDVMKKYFGSSDFDKGLKLLCDKSDGAKNIYYDKNPIYRVYTDEDLADIDIKTKQTNTRD